MTEEELRLCPKCGKNDIKQKGYRMAHAYYFVCRQCNYESKSCDTYEKAVEAWNKGDVDDR